MKVAQMALYRTLQSNLSKGSSNMTELYLQASTGKKVIDSSDDPSAIGSIFNSRSAITVSDRYMESIADVQGDMDIVDGYLDSAENIMVRAKEIATSAINGSLSESDLETYANEVEELQTALLDIANAQVDGKYIFSGYAEQTEPFSGDPVTYQGTSDHKMVEISSGQSIQSNLTGDEVFSSPMDTFTILADLESALSANDTTALETSMTDLEDAADQIRSKRSEMGNINSRLDDVSTMLSNLQLQMEERLSSYEDADLVEVMTGVTQAEQAYEAALSVSSRLSQLSILDYL